MIIKNCFIDVETTGADQNKNSIFELAAIVDFDGKFEARFCMNARPFEDDEIQKEAMDKTRKTEEEIWGYKNTQKDLYLCFSEFLAENVDKFDRTDKMFFVGYNSEFDMRFVRQLWTEMGDKFFGSFFWFPDIDVMRVAAWAMMKERKEIPNFQLFTIARSLGIKVVEDNLHTAMYDTRLVRQIFYKLEE